MENLIDAKKAAALLGVCSQTIYKKFEGGELSGYRLGKAIRFDVIELKEFMRRAARASVQTPEQAKNQK